MKNIFAIVGARPQFIKHAPLELAFNERLPEYNLRTIHTGQHYDENMSAVFFNQLGMRTPDFKLEIGSVSHGAQTGRMMEGIEQILLQTPADAVLVYGDTNSTLAGALVGAKMHLPVFHVEAGLRSFNKSMPEEVNRVLTDHISDILFAPTDQAVENLHAEGIHNGIIRTGDIMFDLLRIVQDKGLIKQGSEYGQYYYVSIHRPYNTDDPERLAALLNLLNTLDLPVHFPMHPRTRHLMQKNGLDLLRYQNIVLLEPVGYFENMQLLFNARAVITDSGGVQKEAYWLKRRCITVRPETEWIETLRHGWNTLVFDNLDEIPALLKQTPSSYEEGIYGNGSARFEIVEAIAQYFSASR